MEKTFKLFKIPAKGKSSCSEGFGVLFSLSDRLTSRQEQFVLGIKRGGIFFCMIYFFLLKPI